MQSSEASDDASLTLREEVQLMVDAVRFDIERMDRTAVYLLTAAGILLAVGANAHVGSTPWVVAAYRVGLALFALSFCLLLSAMWPRRGVLGGVLPDEKPSDWLAAYRGAPGDEIARDRAEAIARALTSSGWWARKHWTRWQLRVASGTLATGVVLLAATALAAPR